MDRNGLVNGLCLIGLVLGGGILSAAEPPRQAPNQIERNPDRFAWMVFSQISQPRDDDSVDWEHWALAHQVYADPNREVPAAERGMRRLFSELATSGDESPGRFDPSGLIQQRIFEANQRLETFLDDPAAFLQSPTPASPLRFDPRVRPQTSAGLLENDEVRMNFDTFKFVMQKELFNIEGQESMFARREKVDFPVNSKEIKAAWRKLEAEESSDQFHTHILKAEDGSQERWGLIALHITTKDLPNWVWATWEHRTNPQREMVVPSRDQSGIFVRDQKWVAGDADDKQLVNLVKRLNGLPSKWTNYVLRGTQIDFVDSVGVPTLLANSIVEEGFQDTSSCITCHARAARGPRKRRNDEGNMLPVFASTDPPTGHIGSPDASWFRRNTSPPAERYWQMDFVWSTIRAKRKGVVSIEKHPLLGSWTYRAFRNEPQRDAPVDDKLVMGQGRLRVTNVEADGSFLGRLEIDDTDPPQPLTIRGTFSPGNPHVIKFEGVGSGSDNGDWLYNYRGYLFPDDLRPGGSPPDAKLGQLPIMAGQVVRSKDHAGSDGAVHPAGQMGTWYMVKQVAADPQGE